MHVCGMCMLPVLSMILMVIIRYISAVLVWILTVLVVLGSLGKFSVFFSSSPFFLIGTFPHWKVYVWEHAHLEQYLFSCQIPVC